MAQKKKKHGPKRPGESYAQQLAREKATRIADGIEIAHNVKQEVVDDLLKLVVIAINDEFGIGGTRLRRLADRLHKVTEEWDNMAGEENDFEYAREVVNRRLVQIFGDDPAEFKLKF